MFLFILLLLSIYFQFFKIILQVMQEDIKEILSCFLEQSKTSDITANHYSSSYSGLKLKAGFGKGKPAKISWITFLGPEQKPQNGIFPVYYFFKEHHKLILAYGVSETNIPNKKWNIPPNTKTVEKYFQDKRITPYKYHLSYVYEVYDTFR